jgi:uncharacterized membrane protein
MAWYIRNDDPHLSANQAIEASMEMMRGHRLRLFELYCSFIGWALLSVLTFGIGCFWLFPYVMSARPRPLFIRT